MKLRPGEKAIKIHRDTILRALDEEPLRPGAWIERVEGGPNDLIAEPCTMCAVGAVLRAHADRQRTTCMGLSRLAHQVGHDYWGSVDSTDVLMAKGRYLSALSAEFELAWIDRALTVDKPSQEVLLERVRERCRALVRQFPEEIEVNFGYVHPAEGVEVTQVGKK